MVRDQHSKQGVCRVTFLLAYLPSSQTFVVRGLLEIEFGLGTVRLVKASCSSSLLDSHFQGGTETFFS